jgi:uncharacterized protein YegL
MKENLTSINVILDSSGSMKELASDTIGSFNSFLKEQKDFPGEAFFTLCTFSNNSRLVHDFVKLADVKDLSNETYHTEGGTALLDAIGSTIDSVGRKLAALPEEERPSKVLFVIHTDGQENWSKIYNHEQIKSMIEHQSKVYSWQFLFIGANIDAISTGSALGVSKGMSVNYTASPAGTKKMYSSLSNTTSSYRSTGKIDPLSDLITNNPAAVKTANISPSARFLPTLDLLSKK